MLVLCFSTSIYPYRETFCVSDVHYVKNQQYEFYFLSLTVQRKTVSDKNKSFIDAFVTKL